MCLSSSSCTSLMITAVIVSLLVANTPGSFLAVSCAFSGTHCNKEDNELD